MGFFDKKEEVIKIELTQYGKYLLSKGKFRPAYYEFFDDDVVYDSRFMGISESQGSIQTRIKDTSRIHPQYTFTGAETQIKNITELVRSGKEKNIFSDKFLPTAEKHYSLSAPIGTSDVGSDFNPAWDIKFLKGEISGTVNYMTGAQPTQLIPQISVNPISYETYVVKPTLLEDKNKNSVSDLNLASKRFDDGTLIQIKDDYILIDVQEQGASVTNENFDIEVYLVHSNKKNSGVTNKELLPLFFEKKNKSVVNNILLDQDLRDIETETLMSPSFASHFFNVYVDKEIDPDILCELLTEEEIKALSITGEFDFNCVKKNSLQNAKLTSDVTDEDLEKC